jgi:hypothetical protein
MPRCPLLVSALLAVTVSGCGSSATETVPSEDAVLTGEITGRFTSQDQGIALDGFLTLRLEESSTGDFAGEFVLEAELDYGDYQEPIGGTGPLVGFVSADQVAALHFTATADFCPQQTIGFTGTFDRRNAALLVRGPILILDPSCAVIFSFSSTIPLRR